MTCLTPRRLLPLWLLLCLLGFLLTLTIALHVAYIPPDRPTAHIHGV